MNQLNQIIIEGNFTRAPEIKETAGGKTLATFSIASNRYVKKADGSFAQETSYFDCEAWGKDAEAVGGKATKGSRCRIVGRLKQDRWKGNDGKSYSRISIVSEHIDLVSSETRSEEAKDETENSEEEKPAPTFDRATLFQNKETGGESEPVPQAAGFDIF